MEKEKKSLNFIEQIIEQDIASGKHQGRVHTRFPPEPNGYLHIGHAKAITINFEIAKKYGGLTNLRFDDTNPEAEDTKYVEAIKRDIKWLGYDWQDREYYASDYFDTLYRYAVKLIKKSLAYVDDSSMEQIAQMKGDTKTPGTNSPYRNRSVEENLRLFEEMKNGQYEDGSKVLRAKIDMSSPNMHMRDPVLYRIKRSHHHRTGDTWCIYPMYDFAHGQSDSIEKITHSLCSLEFRHHRPLYEWLIEKLEIFPSRQIEFARMNVAYMITSKRRLLKLVQDGYVSGWDDPRMPTLSGMRNRGYPPAAIRAFCAKAGVAKRDNLIEFELLESCVRDELNKTAKRIMVVTNPVKLIITNYPENQTEELSLINNPEDPNSGYRKVSFGREIYIERDDFMEEPPKKFFRLGPGRNVRLKGAYIIRADHFIKDKNTGELLEIHCSYYPDSKSGSDKSGIKAKGTLHWVCAHNAIDITINEYEQLFTDPTPLAHNDKDFIDFINPNSLKINDKAKSETFILNTNTHETIQFMRKGYYCRTKDQNGKACFNATVSLKSKWKNPKN